jgi:hypothetical protein
VEENQSNLGNEKNVIEPVLNRIDNSYVDTEQNQVSRHILACCTM